MKESKNLLLLRQSLKYEVRRYTDDLIWRKLNELLSRMRKVEEA